MISSGRRYETCILLAQRRDRFTLPVRIPFVLCFILAISCMGSSAASGSSPGDVSPYLNPGTGPVRWGPYITGTTHEGTCIHVWTHEHIPVILECSPIENGGNFSGIPRILVSSIQDVHHVFTLQDLDPGTCYSYRIIVGDNEYGNFHFMTYPETGPISFVVYGDTRDELPRVSQESRHLPVARAIAAEPDISLVVHTGDLVHDGGNISDWDRFFSTGAEMLANTTFAPVMGNHEQNSTLYFEIFRTPANYTIQAGDFLITILDSNDWSWNTLPSQSAWLSESLSDDTPFKFVALHHPIYSSDEKHWGGFENLRGEWEHVFQKNGVIAVFQGHVHLFERDFGDGITYITEARGGAPWYALAEEKIPEYRKSSENTLGYSLISGEKGSPAVQLRVKTVNPGGVMENGQIEVIEEILLYPHDTPTGSVHRGIIKRSFLPLYLSDVRTCLSGALQDMRCAYPNVQYPPDCYSIPSLHTERITPQNTILEDSV